MRGEGAAGAGSINVDHDGAARALEPAKQQSPSARWRIVARNSARSVLASTSPARSSSAV
jgi:hypothetical protein